MAYVNPYTKTLWVDEVDEYEGRFQETDLGGGVVQHQIIRGEVYTEGTPQDASHFKPLTSTAKQPAPTGETQTFKPVRGNNLTQVYQPIRPAVTETKIPDSTAQWKPVQQHTTATTAEKGATPLNPPVKASAAPESAPASSDSAPKPRVRRTERNKDMYDQNNKA